MKGVAELLTRGRIETNLQGRFRMPSLWETFVVVATKSGIDLTFVLNGDKPICWRLKGTKKKLVMMTMKVLNLQLKNEWIASLWCCNEFF